eukprot:scaffold384898_cov86-Cyclotella_meneghiniana.AAC.1
MAVVRGNNCCCCCIPVILLDVAMMMMMKMNCCCCYYFASDLLAMVLMQCRGFYDGTGEKVFVEETGFGGSSSGSFVLFVASSHGDGLVAVIAFQ